MDFVELFFFFVGLKIIINALLEMKNIIVSLKANNNLVCYGKSSWALVTACTDGIGQGFAVVLAKQGFNIVQVGRNPQKLSEQASDLHSKYGVQVRSVVKDFSECTKNPLDFFTDIYEQTKDLDVSILVNNVGTSSGKGKFANTPIKKLLNEISLNIFPITFLSRLYLPKIMNRDQGGAIINLSSIAANMIAREYVGYGVDKAYDYYLSEIMDIEVSLSKSSKKTHIMCLQPGFVDTPLVSKIENRPLEISKFECAEAALKCLGATSRTSGHWKHLIVNSSTLILRPLING